MSPELPGVVPEIPVNSWGLHEFTAADPDGNLFRVFFDFATPERERAGSATP